MAVPSSGPISLKGIINEIDDADYDTDSFQGAMSLTDFSTGAGDANPINQSNASANRPDGSAPHAMSEFYSYDHDFNPFSSVIADFTISAPIDTGGAGALTADIPTSNPQLGTLSLSVSISGDPGSGGTDNSATGYVAEGTQLSYSPTYSSSDTIYVRFRLVGHTAAANQNRTCTFTSNGQTDAVVITKNTPRA